MKYKRTKWPMVELKEVCEVKSGGTPKRSINSYWNGTIPWVGSTVCENERIIKIKVKEFITEKGLNHSSAKFFKKNTTLIALVGATIGKTGLLEFNCTTNQNVAGLYPCNTKKLNPTYLFYATQRLYSHFLNLGTEKFRMANLSFVRRQKIPLPPIFEQDKIVKILSTWDQAIEKLEKLISAKEKQFKWLLKKLITDKQSDPNWKKIALDKMGNTFSGLFGKSKANFGQGKPFIPYLNVFQNVSVDVSNLGLCSVEQGEKQNMVIKGDVIFTTSSETAEEVGISSVLLENLDECYLNSFCFGWRRNFYGKKELSDHYLKHFFRSSVFRKQVNKLSQGVTRYNLSKKQLMNTWVIYPSITEQKKISFVLDELMKEIRLLREYSEKCHDQKKGLMQRLLTGRIRLK